MFHLEVRFRHAEQLLGSKAESARKEERDIHSASVACNPFRARPLIQGWRPANFAPFARCDTLAMQFNRE
jgi:hypothetical protein